MYTHQTIVNVYIVYYSCTCTNIKFKSKVNTILELSPWQPNDCIYVLLYVVAHLIWSFLVIMGPNPTGLLLYVMM